MNTDILQELIHPKTYEYELSEKLFWDVWESSGRPSEIVDEQKIFEFLNEIVIRSNGWVIFDQFGRGNYDNIQEIKMKDKYTMIIWKNNDKYRLKYLNGTLTDKESFCWEIVGYSTYIYSFLYINKIKFINIKNHLFILLRSNYINRKELDKILLNNNEKISVTGNASNLNMKYIFFEGDKKDLIKHECSVNNLPFYSCLIQPKEGNYSSFVSRDILLSATLDEINIRLKKTYNSLVKTTEDNLDELFSKGNIIRRILEYSLKYYLIYFEIKLDIDQKYGHFQLGKLKNIIKDNNMDIDIPKRIINIANELSHDSGKNYNKRDIINFYNDTVKVINNIFKKIKN